MNVGMFLRRDLGRAAVVCSGLWLSTWSVAAFGLGSEEGDRPQVYSYNLLFYPLTSLDCQAKAEDTAAKLRVYAGVEIYKAECETDVENQTANISIKYISDKPLTITTTNKDRLKDIPNSMYRTAEDCQAGLAEEVAAFEEHLGLAAFESYCYRVPNHKRYPYAIRIDGIGAARDGMRVIDDMEMMFSMVQGDTDALGALMTDRLRERGVAAVRSVVGLEDGISEFFVGSRYYGKQSLLFKLQEVTDYRSVAGCESDRTTLEGVLMRGRVKPLSVFCTHDSLLGSARLYFVMARGDYIFETAPDLFAGRDECLAGKAAVEEVYRTKLGRDVIGGLCFSDSKARGTYALKVYSNP